MEKVFAKTSRTDSPQVFLRELSEVGTGGPARPIGGRVVYFPSDIDRTFWEILSPENGRLLANAVAWATNAPAPVTVSGPGVIDVTLWRQKGSLTVHLVNFTNPMMMMGPIRGTIPVGAQQVRVPLPEGESAKAVRLLVANATPASRADGAWLEVTVPAIAEHELVAVDVG